LKEQRNPHPPLYSRKTEDAMLTLSAPVVRPGLSSALTDMFHGEKDGHS
jgi:hypothetical protein